VYRINIKDLSALPTQLSLQNYTTFLTYGTPTVTLYRNTRVWNRTAECPYNSSVTAECSTAWTNTKCPTSTWRKSLFSVPQTERNILTSAANAHCLHSVGTAKCVDYVQNAVTCLGREHLG
jgi:hypothetical protein